MTRPVKPAPDGWVNDERPAAVGSAGGRSDLRPGGASRPNEPSSRSVASTPRASPHPSPQVSPRQLATALYRCSFFAFVWKVFTTLHRGEADPFVPGWHVEAMCHALEETRRGANRRLIITVPPRHLKSITTAVAFSAFLLGHDPATKIIVASYAQDLARKHSEDFRQILESDWYRALFPATRIAARGARQDEIRTTGGGGRKAVSVGGAVTGFGADYLVVDDLLKASDASSEAELLRAQTYLDGSLLSRLNKPAEGRVIAIQQRLHEDDPAGYLLAKGTYRHLNLPAIAEADEEIPIAPGQTHSRRVGEALCPARMDLSELARQRTEMGSAVFNMMYQQNPLAAEGSPLRWEWFRTYERVEPRAHYQYVLQSWHTAMSADPRSDYSVCTTWGYREGVWHLLDLFRGRLDYPDLKRKVLELGEHWEADLTLIERAGTGLPLIQECFAVNKRYRGRKPWQSKEVRFAAACAPVEAGQVALPRQAPWLADFRRELLSFPRGRYDDQVDSFGQAAAFMVAPQTVRGLQAMSEREARSARRR